MGALMRAQVKGRLGVDQARWKTSLSRSNSGAPPDRRGRASAAAGPEDVPRSLELTVEENRVLPE
jgi:hypothetical protein